MAESKHTPGRWLMAAKPSSVVGWPVVGPEGRVICSLNYVHHSKIDPKVSGDDAFNRESKANGLLIQAAPDLLKALEQIASFGDPWEIAENPEEFGGTDDGSETVCMAFENMQSIAIAALSRARGGPHA